MSDQQILPCTVCGQTHEQMLMLVCMHDPCINCASIHFCTTQSSNSHDYPCSKCGELTELDGSSVTELQKVYSQLKGKKKYDYRRGQGSITEHEKVAPSKSNKVKIQTEPKESPHKNSGHNSNYYNNNQSYTPVSQPSYPTNPYSNVVLRKTNQPFYMCQTHQEEQLSYFCFNCNSPICPQCAIHGTHRDHEVQTTRKAIKTIKGSLQKCQQNVGSSINNLVGIVQSYKNKLKDVNNDVKKQRETIKQSFSQLKHILGEKQKQFHRYVDSVCDSNSNIIKTEVTGYDRLIQQNAVTKKNIEGTLKKDDLSILQEFSKRQKEAQNALQNSQNRRYNPDLDGLKQIDYSLFKDEIDQLTGIITAMKLSIQGKRKS